MANPCYCQTVQVLTTRSDQRIFFQEAILKLRRNFSVQYNRVHFPINRSRNGN